MNVLDWVPWVLAFVGAGLLLRVTLWRAILCLRPGSVVLLPESPAEATEIPAELSALARDLTQSEFRALGSHLERPVLHRGTVCFDFVHEPTLTFATLYLGRDDEPRLYLLTKTASGAMALSAGYRRPSRSVKDRYSSGVLEGASVERLMRVHQRVVSSLGVPSGQPTLAGRLEVAREWFEGPGKGEVRLQNLHGLLWTLGTLGMLVAAIAGRGAR